ALAFARAGRPREAERLLESLLPGPGSPPDSVASKALYVMGVAKRHEGDFSGALQFLQPALDSTPPARNGDLRRMRMLTEIGLTILALGKPQEPAGPLDRALELSRQIQISTAPDRADIEAGLRRVHVV